MDLTEEQREDLIRVLATHLVGFATRRATAEDAGMPDAQVAGDPIDSWRMLVEEAIARGRLRPLLLSAARQSPGDEVLQALAEGAQRDELVLVKPPPSRAPAMWALVAGLIALLTAAGIAGFWYVRGQPDPASEQAVPAGEVPHVQVREGLLPPAPVPGPAPSLALPAEDTDADTEPPPEPAPTHPRVIRVPDPLEEEDPAPAPEPAPAPAPAVTPAPAAPASPASVPAACRGTPGEPVGYAYAGSDPPTVSGGRWAVPQDVNVRREAPSADNGFDTRTPVICVLPRGSSVPAGDPIRIPGGAWWIPVLGG